MLGRVNICDRRERVGTDDNWSNECIDRSAARNFKRGSGVGRRRSGPKTFCYSPRIAWRVRGAHVRSRALKEAKLSKRFVVERREKVRSSWTQNRIGDPSKRGERGGHAWVVGHDSEFRACTALRNHPGWFRKGDSRWLPAIGRLNPRPCLAARAPPV